MFVVMLRIHAAIEQLPQAFNRVDPEMMPALRADLQIFFNGFAPDDLAAGYRISAISLRFERSFRRRSAARFLAKASDV